MKVKRTLRGLRVGCEHCTWEKTVHTESEARSDWLFHTCALDPKADPRPRLVSERPRLRLIRGGLA